MPKFDSLDLVENENIATVTLRWLDEGMSNGVLADLDSLMNYLEDETSTSLILLRELNSVRPSTSSPSPITVEHCRKWENFVVRIDRFAGASLAVIDGSCSHFRFQLALACDYRLATSRSVFRMPEVKEGYLPGMNIFRLAKYTGIGVARRIIFTGAPVPAREALALGILDQLCEAEQLEEGVRTALEALMPVSPLAIQMARRLLNESFSTSFEDAIGCYLAAQNNCLIEKGKR
jgi:enoyl-CoA hydratase/carnithine racemase